MNCFSLENEQNSIKNERILIENERISIENERVSMKSERISMKNTKITFYECPELLSIEALEIMASLIWPAHSEPTFKPFPSNFISFVHV